MAVSFLESPIGTIKLSSDNASKLTVEFPEGSHQESHHSSHQQIINHIKTYFRDPRCSFANIPKIQQGSPFQQKIWRALCDIPSGQTKTYGELAKELSTSARAVGQACKRNPCPIIVPCHRIVGAKSLGGYAGDSDGRLAKIKKWLVAHEKKIQISSRQYTGLA